MKRPLALACVALAATLSACSGSTRLGAQQVTDTSARLRATVSCAGGERCSAQFRWRPVGGSWTTGPLIGPVTGPATDVELGHTATGLRPHTAYEYQVCGAGTATSSLLCAGPDGTSGTTSKLTTLYPTRMASAFAFHDSVGVNTHFTHHDQAYAQWDVALSKLAALGIKHVRDGFHPTPPFPSWFSCQSNLVFNKGFADHGIKALLFMGYKWTGAQKWPLAGDFPNGTVDQHLAGIKRGMQDGQSCDASLTNPVPGVRPEAIEGFEWPNEFDVSGDPAWAADEAAWAQEFAQKLRADPVLGTAGANLPIIGPSIVGDANVAVLARAFPGGDPSPYLDFGNAHPYMAGQPGTGSSENPAHATRELARLRPLSGDKRVYATEFGYSTGVNVDEATDAVYTVRQYLELFAQGFVRSYKYALVDEPIAGTPEREQHFGLYRYDPATRAWTAKPAATAVGNLQRLVGETRPASVAPLDFGLDGDLSDVRQLVLQQGDGSHLLVLWRTSEVFDAARFAPTPLTPRTIGVVLPGATGVETADPIRTAAYAPASLDARRRTTVSLGDDPVVLHVTR